MALSWYRLFFPLQNEHNVSFKDLQNQRVIVPTLEYHNKNWTWTDMLMELKKDYRSVIVQQTLKSAIGMRGSDEVAGLVSPKARRSACTVVMSANMLYWHGTIVTLWLVGWTMGVAVTSTFTDTAL